MLAFSLYGVQLNVIISRMLASPSCSRLLASDGITVSELRIKGALGVIEAISIDVRSARKSVPAIGQTASIAKNLDEYQFLICSLVPSLSDSDLHKLQLQKYRVTTIGAFRMLSMILTEPNQPILEQWNIHAKPLLEKTSEAYLKAKSNSNQAVISRKDIFDFFGLPEDKIEAALASFYGQ